jgi:predicted kinase
MGSPKLILVSGLPGSGKSFFADKLSTRIGAEYLNSDRIRAGMHLRGKYTPADKSAVYEKMYQQTSGYLKENTSVVVDATFHRAAIRNRFFDLARERGVPVFCFEVWATEDLIKKRLSTPRSDSEADYKVYTMIKDEFEAWSTPRLKLQSTQNNISFMLDEAMEYLEGENV